MTAWVFTLHKPVSVRECAEWPNVRYIVWQHERAPRSGADHLQGYVVFNSPMCFESLKAIDKRIHWEPRYGTHAQARDYCKKEYTRVAGPWEEGDEEGLLIK